MLTERDAIKRESGILLASAMADEQLSKALLTVEELTMKLAQEQRDYEQQVNVIYETDSDQGHNQKFRCGDF